MSVSVGQELKKRRQALRLSLTEVELQTKIRGKFLTQLESGNYEGLANDVYSRGFVQNYANYLGLDGLAMAARYSEERGGPEAALTKVPQLKRPPRLVFTGRLAAVGAGLLVILSVMSYLAWQLSALAAPPSITILVPDANQAVTGSVTTVSGHVTPGADVAIDDVAVVSDADGNYSSQVALQNGVNTIRVSAKSKLGKSNSLSRTILAKLPPSTASAVAVPVAPFGGIAVAISAKRTIAISVVVDGKTTKELLLGGTSQLFTGATIVSITTSDAGATSLTITNSVVAAKVIARLGGDGEQRSNQDFTPTTVIP